MTALASGNFKASDKLLTVAEIAERQRDPGHHLPGKVLLVSASKDKSCRVWDVLQGEYSTE